MAWCTADDVVTYASISDPDWDLLDVLVQRACAVIEDWCRCHFETAVCEETIDTGPGQQTVVLSHYPVQQVQAVYENAGGTSRLLAPDEYLVDLTAGVIKRRSGTFPQGPAAVRVIYQAGYGQVPAAVVQAAVMLAADWYRNRLDGRVLRESYDGYSAAYSAEMLPQRVRELLEPYRRVKMY